MKRKIVVLMLAIAVLAACGYEGFERSAATETERAEPLPRANKVAARAREIERQREERRASGEYRFPVSESSPDSRERDRAVKLFVVGRVIERSSNGARMTGSVTNEGTATVNFVRVDIRWMDLQGNVIDTDNTYAVGSESLRPGDTSQFEAYTRAGGVRITGEEVAGYQRVSR